MSREQVLEAIPHRPPFLWVDEVIERSDDHIKTRLFVDPEADVFKGHYPDFPLMPGVLVCEAIFQSGAILLSLRSSAEVEAGLVPVMTRIKDTRFKQMVRPGDTLEIEVTVEDALPKLFHMKGIARVGSKKAVISSFACALAPQAK